MNSEKSVPSVEKFKLERNDELEASDFKLIEHVYPQGADFSPAFTAGSSLTLVLSGTLNMPATSTAPTNVAGCVVEITEGMLVAAEVAQLNAATSVHLWQITGSEGAISALQRFAYQLLRKDPATAAHSVRVSALAARMGSALQLRPGRLERLSVAAYLHDLGKLKLPSRLLQSTERLTLPQWQLMTQHPTYGRQLLEDTAFEQFGGVLEQHHERLNGSGYPHGLRGDAISLETYIVAVADTYDAITHPRPYQRERSPQQALSEINRYSEVLYPRNVVGALNRVSRTFVT